MADAEPKVISLFIDYENVHYGLVNQYNFKPNAAKIAALILDEVSKEGNILIKRAYADWEKDEFKGVQAALKKGCIEPAYTLSKKTTSKGTQTWKDSADAVLLLDALQTMFERSDIEQFVIVTGDRAALDLIHRLRSRGKEVKICALESALAQELVDAVDGEIISIENLLGIEPVGTKTTILAPVSSDDEWNDGIVRLAELEKKLPFVGCALAKQSHGFTQQAINKGVSEGIWEVYQVANPNYPERPTSALRLRRDNAKVIKALSPVVTDGKTS